MSTITHATTKLYGFGLAGKGIKKYQQKVSFTWTIYLNWLCNLVSLIQGSNEVAKLLISNGAIVDVKEKYSGITPLIRASDIQPEIINVTRTDYENVVRTLIRNGADVNHMWVFQRIDNLKSNFYFVI